MADTLTPGLKVETNLPRDPRLYLRDHATFLRESLRDAARVHHERHIPWHFEAFAVAKYGYRPRTGRYLEFKRRRGLSTNPLTFSGRTKTRVLNSRVITATQRSATLKMEMDMQGFDAAGNRVAIRGSGRFRFKPGQTELSGAQLQILERIEELRAISTDEIKYLADQIATKYAAQADAPGTRYRTRNRAAGA